ncbi:MAG: hypothetical protein LKH78_05255 [Weizmannia coagulans]|jgi:hypothetical protein|nr:hypothetical protein [Heyndrickxia coagulans]
MKSLHFIFDKSGQNPCQIWNFCLFSKPYLEVGYGFIKGQSANAINRILGPGAVADFRLREGIFEFAANLDVLYDENHL